MGEKDRARREVKTAGLPTIPGSDGVVEGEEQLAKEAERIGYPLILKASAGGGGRGMRVVRKQEELLGAYQTARSEAQQAFGTPDVYMEKSGVPKACCASLRDRKSTRLNSSHRRISYA